MRLKPLQRWESEGGRQKILQYTDNQELREILSAVLLDYAGRSCHDQAGAVLIRGATEFLNSFLTLPDPKIVPKPPQFNLKQ